MTQHVKLSTRRRCRQTPSVLDLIFTADPNMISNLLHLPPLGYSDHEVLIWSYICYSDPPVMSQDHLVFKFSKGDYVAFNEYLNSIDWISLFNGNDISTNWHIFEEKMLSGC